MCGICGIINKTGSPPQKQQLENMCQSMRHRGPDDEGYFLHDGVGLGMRRLSIIDLETGHQPIHNEDETVWVVLNGEIYNYPELRSTLQKLGHFFYTRSDTEVIVHLYEQFGEDCITHLRGMFAFAIYDKAQKKVLLARDRIGVKPLFYFEDDLLLLFGSEMKSLLRHARVSRELDLSAVDAFLSLLYIPAPDSIFKHIKKLLPGHYLVWDGEKTTIKKYWEVSYNIDRRHSLADLKEQFLEKFRESVRIRMISDVPLGVLLSGGIDSSAVVATMSEFSHLPVETFTVGYGSAVFDFDETQYARIIAKKFATHHHEEIVTPDIDELIQETISKFDEPFADSSAIPNFAISRVARQSVTVALSGLGGDEVGAGYNRYAALRWAQYYHLLPRFVREKMAVSLADVLPDSQKGGRFSERIKKFIHNAALPEGNEYLGFITFLLQAQKQKLYTPEFLRQVDGSYEGKFNSYFLNGDLHWLNRALFTDLKMYLPDDLLTLTDRTSMANSLEVRVPFLDHELVEFMATVPPEYKLKGLSKKYFFKQTFSEILPKEILARRKQGFSVPLVLWFRNELRSYLKRVLSESNVIKTGLFQPAFVQQMINEHLRCKENNNLQLWALVIFVLWYQQFIEE